MTDAWGALAIALSLGGQEPAATVEPIDGTLIIEWKHKQIRPADGAMIFTGGVVAHYGPTDLHADKITIYQSETRREGLAEGNVRLIDPDGTMNAAHLQFDWLHRTGKGSDVTMAIEGLWLHAEALDIASGTWTLKNVKAAGDSSPRSIFSIRSPSVTYRPGRGGTARKATFALLGTGLITLPSYRFGAKRGEQGLSLPSISYNQGLAVAWRSAYKIDDRTRMSGGFRVKRGDRTGAQIELTRSLLPRNEPETLIAPLSDLGERFAYGYFDSVFTRRPAEERGYLAVRRSSVTLGATANQSPSARLTDSLLTKPFDIVVEEARQLDGYGLTSQFRYQHLQEDNGPNDRRLIAMGIVHAPTVRLTPSISTHLRADATAYFGKTQFGWAQVQAGLFVRPSDKFRVGLAYTYGSQTGTPVFTADRLYTSRLFHGRFDWDMGTTKLSFLTKYDFDRRKWIDNEIGVSQVLGPLEPFVTFREFPRTFTFGVRLRAEQSFDRIRRRLEGRTPSFGEDLP